MSFLIGATGDSHATEPVRSDNFVNYLKVGHGTNRNGDTSRKSGKEENKKTKLQHGNRLRERNGKPGVDTHRGCQGGILYDRYG
jgi:hypothetical protein